MFAKLMKYMQDNKLLPQISDTERQALEAGDVWIDGGFFGGNLDIKAVMEQPYGRLSTEEQAFLDGPCEELLNMIDAYEIGRTNYIPEAVLDFVKREGFMGFLIPKEYGGKDFSILAISTILAKLGAASTPVSTLVIIPSSLGAAELIKHYGTDEQKNHYLPKLASGELVPCFGLTEPTAGSDAASIKATGDVFKDADGEIKIKLNFRKRYITLAPIADLCSIACQLRDPDNLLGKGEAPGITVVMVKKGTPGFTSGNHHLPIGESFYNGPLIGEDVVVPTDNIIGGVEYAGRGWQMLMEQLAGGRMVSLPAGAIGAAKKVSAMTGAYCMVRKQFGIEIGRMEGVEEKVGKIAALAYMMDAARIFGCTAVDNGIQPPVVSAIMKAYTTELARELGSDGMDVFSGAGVMQGPNNILGKLYCSAPVGITVEGANIMTRTLMVFGQGATRCHPYAFKVVEAVEQDNADKFRANLLGWMGQFALGLLRSFGHGLTRGWLTRLPNVAPETKTYYRRIAWGAARFGLFTNLAMFAIGGKLKARGKLTGRYSDAVAWMIMGLGALRRFEAEGRRPEDLPLVHYALRYSLNQTQLAFEGMYKNFDAPVLGFLLRTLGSLLLRANPLASAPSDVHSHAAAQTIQHYNAQYRRLAQNVFLPKDESQGPGRLLHAFRLISETAPIVDKIQAAQHARTLPRGDAETLASVAADKGVISTTEATALQLAHQARLAAIEVDEFTPEQYFANLNKESGLQQGELKQAANA